MSLIEATSVKCSTLADGSLRIVVEVPPTSAQPAFSLFGQPGVPMVLGRLTQAAAQQSAQAEMSRAVEPVEKLKGGELARVAGVLCGDPLFWSWLENEHGEPVKTAECAADMVRRLCRVGSRSELDHNAAAAEVFHRAIRRPFVAWRDKQKVPA